MESDQPLEKAGAKKEKKKRKPPSALSRAAWLLGRREYSKKELYDVLVRKEFSPEESQKAVDYLEERGWQSDERTARMLLNSGSARQYGPARIMATARQKGLNPEMVEGVLEASDHNWLTQAQNATKRKYGEAPYPFDLQVKIAGFLARKGYSLDICWKIARNEAHDE